MNYRNALVLSLLAAAGTTASAGVFAWTGASSNQWSNAGNWSGPGGQVPSTVNDSATIAVDTGEVSIQSSLSLGSLAISNGASVLSSGNSVFVAGPLSIVGVGSSLSVTETPALRDLDVDTLSIDSGVLVMYGGLAQIDESMSIGPTGGVLGTGTIEMNSTTGNIDLNQGALWAMGGSGPSPELLIRRTVNSTSKLDWTHPDAAMIAWEGKTLRNELPYTGALGGEIFVSGYNGNSRFVSDNGFIAGNGSEIRLTGGPGNTATVEAPFIDAYGVLSVTGDGRIESPILALRGNGTIDEGCRLTITATSTILHSFAFDATGPDASVSFTQPGGSMSVQSGASVFDLGEMGRFDLDGAGDRVITIATGSSLSVHAGALDLGIELFSGTLNVAGTFHTEKYSPEQGAWHSDGEINMQSGTITGRRFWNSGTISGKGAIDTLVHNDGLIEAVGGTLSFDDLDPGGTVEVPGAGVVRAQQGDIVVNDTILAGFLPSEGSIYVGNGAGPREVFEMNGGLLLVNYGEADGLLSMNGGYARFGRIRINTAFESAGDSVITISGAGNTDGFELFDGQATIDGTLEVYGNAFVWEDAQLSGNGTIDATSTVKRIGLMNGADTGTVSLKASGGIELGDYGQVVGEAHTAGLMMRPTAKLGIDIAGDAASEAFDRCHVSGDATLDGTIEIRWSADLGDAPTGETYTVLAADAIQGSFDSVDFTGLGTNRRAFVTVNPDSVEVFVTCLTDLNGDGLLDLNDINTFVDAFTQGEMIADVAPPYNLLDLSDLNAFVFFFQGGCN